MTGRIVKRHASGSPRPVAEPWPSKRDKMTRIAGHLLAIIEDTRPILTRQEVRFIRFVRRVLAELAA
jgi:hypothetical protein